MGARGPAPKSAEQKILEGTFRRDRDDDPESGPQFESPISVDPPPFLSEIGREIWEDVAPQLLAQDVLKRPDLLSLAQYCESFAVWKKCAAAVEGNEVLLYTDTTVKSNPAIGTMMTVQQTMLRFAQQFGLTPSARVALRSRGGEKDKTAPRDNKRAKANRLFAQS